MKIHCAELVEGALRSALKSGSTQQPAPAEGTRPAGGNLLDNFAGPKDGKVRIQFLKPPAE
jgi:hypothetical protein